MRKELYIGILLFSLTLCAKSVGPIPEFRSAAGAFYLPGIHRDTAPRKIYEVKEL